MYKIVFHFYNGPDEIYSGKSYYVNKEKYATFCSWTPKLFKSEYMAHKVAKRLLEQCPNCYEGSDGYSIEEVDESDQMYTL